MRQPSRKDHAREIESLRRAARERAAVMPTTTPLVRPVGHASDAGNSRKDAGR